MDISLTLKVYLKLSTSSYPSSYACLSPVGRFASVRANNAPKMKIFSAATPELVLLYKLFTGLLQRHKCFSEISRDPTNRFPLTAAELKLLSFADRNIRMWTCLQGC